MIRFALKVIRGLKNPSMVRRKTLHVFKENFHDTISMALVIKWYIKKSLRKNKVIGLDYWVNNDVEVGSVDGCFYDIPTSFFLSILINGTYKSVVEVGSFDGRRIIEIKRLMPSITAFGVDISKAYQSEIIKDGVTFKKFTIDSFKTVPNGSLVITVGALVYLEPEELSSLLRLIREKNMGLAFFEPAVYFPINGSIRRGKNGGYYHPYSNMVDAAGFLRMVSPKVRWRSMGSAKLFEQWYYEHAIPDEESRQRK